MLVVVLIWKRHDHEQASLAIMLALFTDEQAERLAELRAHVRDGSRNELTIEWKRLRFQQILARAGVYREDGGPVSPELLRRAA